MDFKLIQELHAKPTIALVGATNNRSKYGNVIFKDLTRKNFQVIAINHKATTVEGATAYANLTEAQAAVQNIDLVVYVIPPKLGLNTLKEAKKLGLKKAWFQPGASDKATLAFVEKEQFRYLTDHCVMVETV